MFYTYWDAINCRMNYLRERNELENYLNFFEFGINPIQIIQHKICGKNKNIKNEFKDFKINHLNLEVINEGFIDLKVGNDKKQLNLLKLFYKIKYGFR